MFASQTLNNGDCNEDDEFGPLVIFIVGLIAVLGVMHVPAIMYIKSK